mmetsp:Transcript_69965/g.121520  ORF Transcript_69965/g.121520 Transcript_69965/m.121520 type:complete len:214 (+) Transcript_69965:256-897(+)
MFFVALQILETADAGADSSKPFASGVSASDRNSLTTKSSLAFAGSCASDSFSSDSGLSAFAGSGASDNLTHEFEFSAIGGVSASAIELELSAFTGAFASEDFSSELDNSTFNGSPSSDSVSSESELLTSVGFSASDSFTLTSSFSDLGGFSGSSGSLLILLPLCVCVSVSFASSLIWISPPAGRVCTMCAGAGDPFAAFSGCLTSDPPRVCAE